MGHTQLRENMTHNTCIERAEKRVHVTRKEPMKCDFHHPFGMAYRINNEWVPCPGYGEKVIAPVAPEEPKRASIALDEWQPAPKSEKPPKEPIPMPSMQELDDLIKNNERITLVQIGRRYGVSAPTVNNWCKHHQIDTPFVRRKKQKEVCS